MRHGQTGEDLDRERIYVGLSHAKSRITWVGRERTTARNRRASATAVVVPARDRDPRHQQHVGAMSRPLTAVNVLERDALKVAAVVANETPGALRRSPVPPPPSAA
jgi:hypothetical protein